MTKYRILIVDGNIRYQSELRDYLTAQDEIVRVDTAVDGLEAAALIKSNRYDIVVTELIIPKLDGFGLLEQISLGLCEPAPAVIVISSLRQDDMVRRACMLGARYFMVKPAEPETVYKRIMDIVDAGIIASSEICTVGSQPRTLDEKITSVFLTIGIPAHIKGYHYLREAIRMVYYNPDIINRITKELYPGIAKRFSTSPSKVERAIRHAIEVAWTRGKIENINRLFGYNIYNKNDKPTNGEFVALIADKMIMESRHKAERDKDESAMSMLAK